MLDHWIVPEPMFLTIGRHCQGDWSQPWTAVPEATLLLSLRPLPGPCPLSSTPQPCPLLPAHFFTLSVLGAQCVQLPLQLLIALQKHLAELRCQQQVFLLLLQLQGQVLRLLRPWAPSQE